jgi:Uma2 family endonuclease
MSSAAAQDFPPLPVAQGVSNVAQPVPVSLHDVPKAKIRRMGLVRWRNWKPADGWKYDWDAGIITKAKKMVKREQRYIVQNILDAFYAKGLHKKGGLIPEAEMAYSVERYRIPDLAYFTKEQTRADAEGGAVPNVAGFVIEVISDTDTGKSIEDKLWEYFENGVQVVWQIFPSRQLVYTSPLNSTLCIKEMVCSAAPALPEFEMPAASVFTFQTI